MAGRKIVIPIWPLNFLEYIEWQNDADLTSALQMAGRDVSLLSPAILNRINLTLVKFITYGGYPAVALANETERKKQIISELLNSYLLRDAQLANYAADPLQVKKILTILADQTGGLLDIQNLCVNTGLTRTIIINRLALLQNTFILHLLRPYFTNKLKELVKNTKVFLVDTGIYGGLMQDFSLTPQTTEFGQLAENFAITEINKHADITDQFLYWRTKQGQEVDLVWKHNGALTPIEIKGGNCDRVPSGLLSFIRSYQPTQAYVLNWSIVKDEKFGNCLVKFRPLWWISDLK